MSSKHQPLLFSPHFDDVVLSASSFLEQNPGAIVATVCSGTPSAGTPLSEWDEASGFRNAAESSIIRRNEDRAALDVFGAQQQLLGFFDTPYWTADRFHEHAFAGIDEISALSSIMGALLDELEPTSCALPLGIFNVAHLLTRRAALIALSTRPWCKPLVYCDLPYSLEQRYLVTAQLKWMGARFVQTAHSGTYLDRKHEAVACYRSQLGQLPPLFGWQWGEMFTPEAEQMYVLDPARVKEMAKQISPDYQTTDLRSAITQRTYGKLIEVVHSR